MITDFKIFESNDMITRNIFDSIEYSGDDSDSIRFWDYIKNGGNPNIVYHSYNLLIWAIDKNQIKIASYLVNNTDIDINYLDDEDRNALTFAVVAWSSYVNDKKEMSKLIIDIIEKGSEWNVLFNGKTFLDWLELQEPIFYNLLIKMFPDKYKEHEMNKNLDKYKI